MIKKVLLTIVLSFFVFIDYSCVTIAPKTNPPPRKITVRTRRPGRNYIWVKGHWNWKRGTWLWRNGYWVKKKSNKRWIPGRWRKRNGKKIWVKGHWVRK